MEYLTKLENGIPITDLGMILNIPPYFKWQFPNLDLRIVNNSNKTIFITDIFIDVEKSTLDPYPVLVIPGEEPNALHFLVVNDGWGDVQDAVVRFNLVPKGYPISFEEPYQYERQIGTFSDSYNVDISDDLRQMGVDVDFINGFNNSWEQKEYQSIRNKMRWLDNLEEFYQNKDNDEDYRQIINALGVFKDSINTKRLTFPAVAYGEISFNARTIDGTVKRSTVKFSTEVTLLVPGGYGAPVGPTYQYHAKLDVDREKYQVCVQGNGSSVSQQLKQGDIDRFNIRVGASKSSLHTFRLRLIYNDNQSILSPLITLKIFVPKSEMESIRGIAKIQEALRQNSSLDFNPTKQAQTLADPAMITTGNRLIELGKYWAAKTLHVLAVWWNQPRR